MLKVVSYEYLEETDVYDLWIDDDDHSFYCQDIPVHNSVWCRDHDGRIYDSLEAINKDIKIHFNCRSEKIPLTRNELENKRASQFGATDEKFYEDWYLKQDDSFHKSTLTNKQYNEFLKGKYKVKSLADITKAQSLESISKTLNKTI